MSTLGREFICGNRELWNGPGRRALLLKVILCAGLLSGLSLSSKLWLADRAFPTIPALPGLPNLPQTLCLALAWLFVACVLAVALTPSPGLVIYAIPALGAVLVLFDITRLQPWFYQYLLLFVALGGFKWSDPGADRSKSALAVFAFILLATYFWSGLQKANGTFAETIFPWLLHPLGLERLQPFWFVAPILETAVGILLIMPRTRAWGLAGAVAMHLVLLMALGPFGQNFNPVVWPWNLCMPTMAFVLFFRNPEPILRIAWGPPVGKTIVVLVGVMPALSFFGRWDAYLSASLYSGKTREAFIMLTEEGARRIPPYVKPHIHRGKNRIGLDIVRWSLSELSVPPYPEVRVYQALARKLQEAGVPPEEMTLVVTDRTSLLSPKPGFIIVPIR